MVEETTAYATLRSESSRCARGNDELVIPREGTLIVSGSGRLFQYDYKTMPMTQLSRP